MNNKTALTIKLIALIIAFLLVLTFSLRLVFGGFSSLMSFNLNSKLLSSESYKDIDKIEVSTLSYSIRVEEHDGSDIALETYSTGIFKTAPLEVKSSGGALTVKQPQPSAGINLGSGRVVIKVPEGSRLAYSLESVSGSVRLDAPSSDAVIASVSGSVRANEGGGSLAITSVSGSVGVSEPFKTVTASSASGSVRAVADGGSESLALGSTSGSIKIMLADGVGYTLDFGTTSGSVRDDYRGASYGKNGSAEWGDKRVKITAQTTSGSIRLCDWADAD